MPEQAERTRTFQWSDPALGAQFAQKLSGLKYLQAVADGRIPPPPIMAALGLDHLLPQVEAGKVTFFLEAKEFHYNTIGSVHGGVIATLMDSAMGCAIHTTVQAGSAYTTLELSVNYVRPVTMQCDRLRCEGLVLSTGRRVATAQASLLDEQGRLYAHATTTCLIINERNTETLQRIELEGEKRG